MGYIKDEYSSHKTAYEAKNAFLADCKKLLTISSDYHSSINFNSEMFYFAKFFEKTPAEDRRELFIQIVDIVSNYAKSAKNLNGQIDHGYLKLIPDLIIKETTRVLMQPHVKDISSQLNHANVVATIGELVNYNYLDLAESYCDLFLTKENRHIKTLLPVVEQLNKNRSKQGLLFLIKEFYGWESHSVLKTVLKYPNIDDTLLEAITNKIGKFNDENIDIFTTSINLNSHNDIPNVRKREILEKFSQHKKFNHAILAFYLDNLENGEFTVSSFQKSSIKEYFSNEEELTSWCKSSFTHFVSKLKFLTDNNIVKKDILENIFLNATIENLDNISEYEHSKIINGPYLNSFDTAVKFFESDLKKIKWQKTFALLCYYSNDVSYYAYKQYAHHMNIGEQQEINIHQNTYSSIKDMFIKKRFCHLSF